MRNSTFCKSGFSRLIFLIVLLLTAHNASAQFYTKHYIAPAPWQYFSKANEIVISTNSLTEIDITVAKSDGTTVTTLKAKKGNPAVYRFSLLARNLPMNALNTVLNGAGLIVTSTGPTAVNLRNIASDDYSNDENRDANIKGNAALTSFGDAGLGIRFRVGYYRDGSLGSFSTFGDQRPIYSIMATANNTTIKINNAVTTTLNQGQSYLFKAPIGTLVESSNPAVMNTSAAIDMPGGCGDGAFNQIPPESVLGTEYFLERGTGNDTAEQTTVVATKDDTNITVESYSTTGVLVNRTTKNLALAGSFYTFVNGVQNTNFTASRIVADKRVAVYSGTAQNCEVDISTIAPVSECGGSEFVETTKFKSYNSSNLDYFGYILLRSATEDVTINGVKTTSISGVGARYQIGSTGWYIINFNSEQIGRPEVLSIESKAKLTVSIVQQAGGFSMAGFFSTFASLPEDPTLTYIEGGGCTNNTAKLTTQSGFDPYQWYYNGVAISGANSSTYIATKTGNYSVSYTLACGAQTPSKTAAVTLCTDLGITKTVDNATPCIGSNVEFTVKVSNLGGNNVSGISVTDLLPSGYTYVSSTPSVGVYDSTTGIWTIGDVEAQSSMTLKIVATVNASGNYTNTASLPNGIDNNTANNSASAAINPKSANLVVTNPTSVCAPATVNLTASAVTAGSSSNLTLSYWTNSGATAALSSPNAVTTSGTYYIKAVSADGCTFVKPVVVTINPQPSAPSITSRTSGANIINGSISCFGGANITLRATSSTGYLWSTGETTRDIVVTTDGTYSVKVLNSTGCISDSSSGIFVTFTPAAPTASDQSFCASENKKVSDLVATGTNLRWYNQSSGGTQYAANATLTAGNYYVSQTSANGCESPRAQVKVTISASSAPVASAQTFCFAENKKINDLVASGDNLKWYNQSSGGTQYTGTETLVTGNYYVSQTAGTCAESARTLVAVTINNVPSAPTASPQTFCATDKKTINDLTVTSGSNLKWYIASTGGSPLATTDVLTTRSYYVSQTNSCGESARTAVSVTINTTAAPTASAQTFCSGELKKVSDLSPSGASYKWYNANTGGTLYGGNETLVTGTYYVSQTANGCESVRTAVNITVNQTPAAPAASAQTFCSSENKKVKDLVATGSNLKWYDSSAGGTQYSGDETLTSGNYYVSQTINSCESTRLLVSVTVNPTPTAPSISADGATTFCQGGSVTLTSTGGSSYLWSTGATTQSIIVSASGNYSVKVSNASGCYSAFSTATTVTVNAIPSAPTASAQTFCSSDNKKVGDLSPSGASYKWYSASTGGTLYTGTETLSTGTYYVSQTLNGCESSRASVSVTVNATPSAPTVSAQTFCSADNKKVGDLSPSGASYKWYSATAGGTLYTESEALATGTYYVSQTLNGCESSRTSVSVTVNATPSAPTASAQTFCSADNKKVGDLSPSGASYKWYSANTGGTLYAGTEALATGTYYVSQTSNGCESSRTSVSVTVNTTPSAPTASAQTFCSSDNKKVSDLSPSGASYKWYSASTGGTLYAGTEMLATGTYYVSQTSNGCESSRTSVSITVNTTPSTAVLSAITQPTCLDAMGSFTINNYNSAYNYTITPSAGVTNNAGTITAPTGNYTISVSSNGCSSGDVSFVIKPILCANDDNFGTKSSGSVAATIGNVKTNDTLNGVAVTNANTIVTIDSEGPLSVDANGDVTLAANTPSGTYSITYEICEKNANPANCKTATAEVKVVNTIDAVLDAIDSINGNIGGTTVSVIGNDTLNGKQAAIGINSGEVAINIVGTLPSGLTLNANGTITVAPNTPKGNYNVEYRICEIDAVPANCDSVTITVPVTAGNLVANADEIPSVLGSNAPQTLGKNVFDNDTKNSQPLDPADVTLKTTVADPKGYLTVDANGNIVLGANPPAGDYELTYEICEKLNPDNCSSNTVKVTVGTPVIDAVEDAVASINGNIGGTTISLISNDTLNGNPIAVGTAAGEVKFEIIGTLPAGLTLNSDYTITVAPNTPKGNYNVEYRICENTNPANCDSVIITVPVTAGNLVANADEIPSVLGSNAPQTLGKNVFANDTKNAQPLNPSDVTLKTTVADPKGYLTVDANGNIVLGANPPAGDYELAYEICEKLNPDNCSSNTVKVTVGTPVIDAVEDAVASINGNIGGTTISLISNDTLNGNPIAVGTAAGEVKFEIIGTLPAGLTLNSDYTITVAPNTPKGNYNVEYRICENTNPANCDSVIITVPVTAGNLVANADEIPSVLGSNAPQTLGKNVFANDTKNAQPVNPSDVTLKTTVADPKGYLTVDANGNIVLGANPPAGDYELTYEICEKLNPDNCSSNTVKVTVGTPVIDAVEDAVASINGNIGGTTISLISNDTLNGNPIAVGTAAGEVNFEIVGTLPTGLALNSDYTITVAPNTPKGNYNVEYKICENTNPANCDSVTITVPVTAGNLVANADEIPSVLGSNAPQTLGKNVFDNDTKNAQPLNPSDVTLKTTVADPKGYLTVDANGNIVLGANPPAGDYELTYEICEKLNPDNCSSNTVKVIVGTPVIDAVEDAIASINGNIGGKTISLIANDKLNGSPITVGTAAGEVKFEIIGTLPTGLTLNSDYTITVAPNTPKGNYNVEYKICENTNPTNCDSVTITVPVTAGNLVANADEIPSVLGSNAPQTLGKNVFDNDTKNAQPLDPADVTLKITAADPKGYLTVDANGNIVLGANPPAGTYELTYEICEKLNLDNCSSNTVKVTVGTPVIDAVEDVIASINGNIGGTTISLIANDKLNGSPITVGTAAGEVKFEIIGTLPTGLTLNSDYTITVAPNTPAADYNVEYKICENTNPTNCDSVITIIKVTGGNLIANEDLVPAVGVNVPQKVINVFENDTKDGNKLVPSDVDLKLTQADPKGYLTVDADGNVVLAPNAPAGEYELTYTICEKLNPNNCDSNVVKVTVTEPKMTVVANSYCSNNVPYVNYTVTPDNFTTNNLLTVKWIDSNNNVVATQTNLPLSGNILWPGAEIDSKQNGTDWPGWILNNGIWAEGADGFEATRNGVKIQFSLNPTVTVSVAYPPATPDCNARPTFSIKANNDEAGPINVKKGANATINIFENDLLNGAKIKASDVILSVPVVHPNISLNADGSINIAANTADGVYELTYQICEAANTSNCSQAVIKIIVDNVVDPATPTDNKIILNNDNDVSADGINGSLEFVNVLDNDLINGKPINPADVTIKSVTESPYFEWNADGTVNVKPNTPGGNYPLTYQVCEKANGTNCSTAVLNVFVEVPAISVIKTAVFNDENKSGFANAGETITYKFTVTNTGNVPLVGITINDPLPGVVVSGQAINLGVNESNETNFTAIYKITQEDINRGSVSNQATVKGSSVRGVVVEDQSDDASNSGDSPTVLDLNGCSIKVMNAFSPNGDSKNARFYIRGIECYPDNTVEIYNRWGVLVFSIDQYNNNDRVFVGYSNGRSTIKQTDGLPVGTYFYILKYKDSAQKSHQESGYLYLNK